MLVKYKNEYGKVGGFDFNSEQDVMNVDNIGLQIKKGNGINIRVKIASEYIDLIGDIFLDAVAVLKMKIDLTKYQGGHVEENVNL